MATQPFDSFRTEPEHQPGGKAMRPFDPMRAPDYDAQADPSTIKGQAFDPLRTAPDHTAQGDAKPAVFEDPGRAGRPYTREASGATGARSGSVSRERSQSQTRGRDTGIDNGSGARRVLSPSRAMGARSASITRNGSNDASTSPTRGRRDVSGSESSATTGFRSPSAARQA